MKNKKTQKINCNVTNCEYNDTQNKICDLNEVKISDKSNNREATNKSNTICDSFESKKDN